ncbi:MAG: relaxase/mobilization nuclease domain-containing protein [Oscillospiraceae bacterium]|nr:relaxase/mobilization nuclease domain-containing protein [Oscillospiraceae bacterium]
MPFVKSKSIRATVQRSLAYILNPEKTDDLVLTSSLNCLTDPEGAYYNMKMVYERFSGKRFDEPIPKSGKGRVKAIHYIQSFDPKDKILPELAHRIGKAFALKVFGKDSQVVIATHIDKEHIHTHFIVNAYGVDGHKFNDNKETLQKIREESDRVCLAFGIKPIEPRQGASGIDHSEWEHKQRGTSWKEKIRDEIDKLILKVKDVDELLAELEILGYTVKRGKYISIKAPDQQRAVRLKTLGEDYTVEQLASRILWRDVGAGLSNPCERSALRDKYSETISGVQEINASHPSLEQLGMLLSIINRDRLQSIGEVDGKIEQIKFELEKSRQEVNIMETKCNLLRSLARMTFGHSQAEEYFALMDKPTLTAEEQLRAEMYKETLAQKNIESRSDLDYLKGVIADTEEKSAPVKAHYNRCAALLNEYSDISTTYEEISQGDYISKLIEQERKKDEPQMRPRR